MLISTRLPSLKKRKEKNTYELFTTENYQNVEVFIASCAIKRIKAKLLPLQQP